MRQRYIYRVEHQDGKGIFRCCVWKDVQNNTRIMQRHGSFNTPSLDGLDLSKDEKIWFCAYKTKKDLLKWLTITDLTYVVKNLGLRVYRITVKEYQIGEYQVIYPKESILKKEDITNLIIK